MHALTVIAWIIVILAVYVLIVIFLCRFFSWQKFVNAGRNGEHVVELRVICAWCGEVMNPGTKGAEITHGICDKCQSNYLENMIKYENKKDFKPGKDFE